MGSVMDYIECPNCGQEAFTDFFYKTGEEYTNCGSCGYHKSVTIKNREKPLNQLTEEDWDVVELKKPYGSYRIKQYDAVGTLCGSLVDEQEKQSIIDEYMKNSESIEFFIISKYSDGEFDYETIIDNGPKYDSAGFTHEDN